MKLYNFTWELQSEGDDCDGGPYESLITYSALAIANTEAEALEIVLKEKTGWVREEVTCDGEWDIPTAPALISHDFVETEKHYTGRVEEEVE